MDKRRSRRRRKRTEEPVNFWQSGLFKLVCRLLLAATVILIFLTLTQCTIKKPEAPEWNTTFVVPVINRTYDMEELVRAIDQDEIIIDTSGDVAFSVSEDLDTVQINSADFAVGDLSYLLSEDLAPLEMQAPSPVNAVLSFSDLTSGLPVVPGFDTVIIPPNTELEAARDQQMETFTWVEIGNGGIKIVITNELGLTLYDVVVRVLDNADGTTIKYDTLDSPLTDGDIDSAVLVLDGEIISNDLKFSAVGHTDTTTEERVDPNGKQITVNASFVEPFEIVSAQAAIPALDDMSLSEKVGLDLGESESLDSAQLETGNISVMIANNTPLSIEMVVSTPGLCLSGDSLTFTRLLAGGQTTSINADLAGYTLIPDEDSVVVNVVARVPGSGGALVVIDENDYVRVDAQLTNFTFNQLTGVMENTLVQFDGTSETLDVPDGFDNVELLTAILTLEIENGVDFPGYLDILISGDNGKQISLSGNIEPSGDQPTRISSISNNDVADFLTPLPTSIDVSGTVEFGDGVYHGTISRDDFVFSRVHFYAPLEIRINNAEVTDLDIEMEEIEQEDIDMITDHVIDTRFVYTVTNHLPLGVTAIVSISNDTVSLFTSPLLTLDTLSADPAPVSLATGIATSAAVSTGELSLDNDDVQILKNDTLSIRPQIFLNASDTAGVKLTENDYITISARIEVVYRFDGDF